MYLIIGGTSFIGVHTALNFLDKDEKVYVTGRNNKFRHLYEELGVDYYNLDLTNKDSFEELPKNIKGIILLAGYLPANAKEDLIDIENADKYFEINTIGTINVVEFARKNGINRVISTCSYADVINSWRTNPPMKEDEPRNYLFKGDHAVYVFSKNAANDVLEYYNQQHNMKNAIFRLPMVYGVGPHGTFKVNGETVKSGLQVFIDNATEGKDIFVYGDKDASRDFVYVKDVSEALFKAIKSEDTYGIYNITSGFGTSLETQANVIAEVFAIDDKKKSNVIYKPEVPNNIKPFLFSIDKAKKDFGYEPKYTKFRDMMMDYKKDLKDKKLENFFGDKK